MSGPSRWLSSAFAFFVLLSSASTVNAQADSRGDAVVVTATRTPTRADELTSDVTVIDREQLDRAGATLREVMRTVPGVEMSQAGGEGSVMSLFIRGANSDHVLVLVDGVRLGSASLGTTAFENLPLSQIERIEVLRGPASSLYGSGAIGGVVQIFTRSGRGNPGFNFSAGYGSYDTYRLSAGVGREKDGLRYAIQAGGTYTSGINALRNASNTSFNPDADGYRNANVTGQLARDLGPGREVGLRLLYSEGRTQFDSIPAVNDFRTYSNLNAFSLYGRTRIGERISSQLTVGTSSDDSTSYVSATSQSSIRTVQDQLTWQNDVTLPVGRLLASLETVQQRLSGTTSFAVTHRDIDSLVLGYQAALGRHHLQLSGRDDRYDQFGNKNSHYAGYGFDLAPAIRLTAGTGTAFKAPSFNQLYFPAFGNPNLLPETARSDEIGLRYSGRAVQVNVVHFRNRIANLIVNAGAPLRPLNVGQASITGTTLSATSRILDTDISASVSDQDPRDQATGLLLPRRAERFGNLSAARALFGGKAGVEVYATEARYEDTANLRRMGGYALLNAFFEKPIQRNWSAYLRLDNLGDRVYETVRDFNVPGRSVFIGVRYQEL